MSTTYTLGSQPSPNGSVIPAVTTDPNSVWNLGPGFLDPTNVPYTNSQGATRNH